ncbi:class I SAM-dependent methyltransferase [Roseibium sediminicola]|uniref:Class I SAM-dependent methyltransferase n=1 Tax=Roseibium sediminicola TaxID=2933272 RepID=A0ABT0GYM4_9HYPH|nr:class I SAM-dependent methyltransferase [Roseibium sp. CAU 1639]MCK7614544.1 class I SAM-dependent methyltransferase [Roseibium sp. CAU 1639]
MAYDYDELYRTTPYALGEPTGVIADFFKQLDAGSLSVLDIGCGQGRDALFLARMGHSVLGVDLSSHGIDQLLTDARREKLSIEGVVADLAQYCPDRMFDVVLIDRTLHMLNEAERHGALARLLNAVKSGGWLLIADERSNLPGFQNVLAEHGADWRPHTAKRGYLFVQRQS